jgi:hypothetical protein
VPHPCAFFAQGWDSTKAFANVLLALDFAFAFEWRSAGAPQHAWFWRDRVERFTAATTVVFSMRL